MCCHYLADARRWCVENQALADARAAVDPRGVVGDDGPAACKGCLGTLVYIDCETVYPVVLAQTAV
jgi:hypothetical protein